MQEFRNASPCIMAILHYGDRPTRDTRRTELKMSMQCLRDTMDSREFETRLTAMRHAGTGLDAMDLLEIQLMRKCLDECDSVRRAIDAARPYDKAACVTVSSAVNAKAAIHQYALERGEAYDTSEENDGAVIAWGFPDDDRESEEITWYVRLIVKENT
jgi:hypothetical protein